MTSPAASTACSADPATTTAIMSPTKRTVSLASAGRLMTGGAMAKAGMSGRPRSPAVYTPTTPGILAAASVSTDSIRAWAIVDRTKTAVRQPGNWRSATYRAPPERMRGSSRRLTGFPRIEVPVTAGESIGEGYGASHAEVPRRRRPRQGGHLQPPGPARVLHPRHLRVRPRPRGLGGQVDPRRPGQPLRLLRPHRPRRGVAIRHAHLPLPLQPGQPRPRTQTEAPPPPVRD